MVQFHQHIISDLLEDPSGGLIVLSSGLGLPKLISTLLQLHDPSQGALLILSASPAQKTEINFRHSQASEITSDLPAHQRLSLYTSGGIFFITARILIVDLLTSRIPTTSVAGIILLNAHSLSDTSTEAFIVRILRSSNRSLYVRAFSDRPHAMVSGFAKAERILKCLSLRKLHLWPRFQVYVSQDLERNPPEVIDIRVPMSSHMLGIQKAVIEVMDACLKEMRQTNKVDVEDLTVENGLFKSFDEIVRRQLDPIWHTLGRRTKQLVSDLKTLRKLLDYLARYDAVTYLKYLDSLRASESFQSVWVFADSSYKIFEYAKKRVYLFGRLDGRKRKIYDRNEDKDDSSVGASGAVVLEKTLEEPPKWKEILLEIQGERQKQAATGEELLIGDEGEHDGIVLVACKDERSCMQLQDCITKGQHKDENFLGVNSSLEPQSVTAQNLITRKAGGKKELEKEMQVIVDMREFMSSLPNVLHQKGIRIIPVTLEVGDYILSPLICVERKSIQDLFSSFSSGRLYNQVEMMSRYYRLPVLLIEFSQDKSFSFQSVSDIGDDVTPNSIISKLSLLALHFPRLRIVWSRSLHATAEIFATLKANQDEPDEVKAIRVGVPSEEGIIENDIRAENYNTSAVEFLRRLPGVTDSNYRSIMDGCNSLAELALLPIEKLAELMGGQKAAKTLRDFLDAKYPTLL